MKKSLFAFIVLAATLFGANTAFADCGEDLSSPEWASLSSEMTQNYESGNYEEALNDGKRLMMICDHSPIINYTMSMIYSKLGNETESVNYIRRATEFASEYSLPQPILEKIWMVRAEHELPYKRQLAECESNLEYQKTAFEETILSETTTNMESLQATLENKNQEILNGYRTNMIIGTGIASAGAAMLAVGIPLLAIYHGKASDEWDSSYEVKTTKFNDYNKNAFGGFALLGLGIGAGIAGTIMAIYNKVKLNDFSEQMESEKSLSFHVSPTYVGVDLTF